jgi:hypothetical protein
VGESVIVFATKRWLRQDFKSLIGLLESPLSLGSNRVGGALIAVRVKDLRCAAPRSLYLVKGGDLPPENESERIEDTGPKKGSWSGQNRPLLLFSTNLNVVQATRLPVTAPQRSGRSLLSGGAGLRIRAYLIDIALGGFQPSEALTWPMN